MLGRQTATWADIVYKWIKWAAGMTTSWGELVCAQLDYHLCWTVGNVKKRIMPNCEMEVIYWFCMCAKSSCYSWDPPVGSRINLLKPYRSTLGPLKTYQRCSSVKQTLHWSNLLSTRVLGIHSQRVTMQHYSIRTGRAPPCLPIRPGDLGSRYPYLLT